MGKLSVRRFLDELIAVEGGNQKPLRTAQIASNATFHKSSFFCSGVQVCRRPSGSGLESPLLTGKQ